MSEKNIRPAYVYIVQCADGTLYTGWTYNLEQRIANHNAGRGAKYTRPRLPVTLVYSETLFDQSVARRREYAIKQLTRDQKIALIQSKEEARDK